MMNILAEFSLSGFLQSTVGLIMYGALAFIAGWIFGPMVMAKIKK